MKPIHRDAIVHFGYAHADAGPTPDQVPLPATRVVKVGERRGVMNNGSYIECGDDEALAEKVCAALTELEDLRDAVRMTMSGGFDSTWRCVSDVEVAVYVASLTKLKAVKP